jgi:glycosyltransferase involved in cell wall biosynthesis
MLKAFFRVRYGAEMGRERKIKILFMIDSVGSPRGGTEGQLFHVLSRLDRSRFQPFLCCLWSSTPWIEKHAAPCEHAVLFQKPIRWFQSPCSIIRLRNFIRDKEFDIVHTFFPTSNILGVVASRLASVPTIISSRRDLGYWRRRRDWAMLRAVRRTPTCIVANSLAVKREVVASEKVDPRKIVVVYNGVDLGKNDDVSHKQAALVKGSCRLPRDSFVVGVIANYNRAVKGVEYFVEAAGLVAAEIANAFFLIVGSGPPEQEIALRRRICKLGLEHRFILAGSQKDVRPFLATLDVGVLPSLSEGFSNSLLEYMAAGVPPVATEVGGNPELVTDNETGLLVKAGLPAALADKIILLLRDARLKETIGARAKNRAKTHFSMTGMVREMEKLYQDLYSRNPDLKTGGGRHSGPSH